MWRPDQVGESMKGENSIRHDGKETMTKGK